MTLAIDATRIERVFASLSPPKFDAVRQGVYDLVRDQAARIHLLETELADELADATPPPELTFVLVRLTLWSRLYIDVSLATGRGSKSLRRWPWPPEDEHVRVKSLAEGRNYGSGVARLLAAPFEVDKLLAEG